MNSDTIEFLCSKNSHNHLILINSLGFVLVLVIKYITLSNISDWFFFHKWILRKLFQFSLENHDNFFIQIAYNFLKDSIFFNNRKTPVKNCLAFVNNEAYYTLVLLSRRGWTGKSMYLFFMIFQKAVTCHPSVSSSKQKALEIVTSVMNKSFTGLCCCHSETLHVLSIKNDGSLKC